MTPVERREREKKWEGGKKKRKKRGKREKVHVGGGEGLNNYIKIKTVPVKHTKPQNGKNKNYIIIFGGCGLLSLIKIIIV